MKLMNRVEVEVELLACGVNHAERKGEGRPVCDFLYLSTDEDHDCQGPECSRHRALATLWYFMTGEVKG